MGEAKKEGWEKVCSHLEQIHENKDPLHREYEIIQAAKQCDLPLDIFRQMFNDYSKRQLESKLLGRWQTHFVKLVQLTTFVTSLASLSWLIAVITYVQESPQRYHQAEVERERSDYQAWQIVNSSKGQQASLGRIDALKDLNKHKVSLAGIDVQNASLIGIKLKEANLIGANLKNTTLWYAELRGANLQKADLSGADLYHADLHSPNLDKQSSVGKRLVSLISSAGLVFHSPLETQGQITNLRYANLKYANLTQADLRGVDLTQADLTGANLTGAKLQGAKLKKSNVNLANAVFDNKTALDTEDHNLLENDAYDLSSHKIDGKLKRADLQNVNLSNVDLSNTELSDADLRNTNLRAVNFNGADLENANLTGAKDLTKGQIMNATNWKYAKYDDEFCKNLENSSWGKSSQITFCHHASSRNFSKKGRGQEAEGRREF